MTKTLIISRIKLIIASMVLLSYIFIILLFSDELFPYIWVLLGFPIFIIPIAYIYISIKSIELIRKNNNILNWIPLFILIIIIIIYIFLNPLSIRQAFNYKRNYEKRNNIVNDIIREKDINEKDYIKILDDDNDDISCNGKVYVHKNTKNETLIEFCITLPFPDGGYSLFYSSGNETLIKKNINYISDIKKMDKNWYLVHFK